MRVLLVSQAFRGSARGLPLGLAHLGSVLEANDFDVHIADIAAQNLSEGDLVGLLEKLRPDILGVTAVCANYLDAINVVSLGRKVLGPSAKIVMGGPHVSFGAETVLLHHEAIDVCVIGEGELTVVNLLQQFDRREVDLAEVRGIAFKVDGKVIYTRPSPQISDLDILPWPARHLFDISNYPSTLGPLVENASKNTELIASRGCPYPCEFCSTKEFWGKKYRRRSAPHVIAELSHLASMGYTDLYFDDDIFTIERKWVVELCDLIIEQGLPIRWACGTRVDRVDLQLLLRMKEAGCRYIYFGVESGDEAIIDLQRKKSSVTQAELAFDLMREAGIYSSAALIFGLQGETWETAKQTVDWVRDTLRPNELWISKACCYPGTPLARKFGITAEDYEVRAGGRCSKGWLYGSGGIHTPFFNNDELVLRIWDYVRRELGHLDLGFGDEVDSFVLNGTDATGSASPPATILHLASLPGARESALK
jgi:anaerobic magnesium-protoporphyrin IX monomethyl ester cyclase